MHIQKITAGNSIYTKRTGFGIAPNKERAGFPRNRDLNAEIINLLEKSNNGKVRKMQILPTGGIMVPVSVASVSVLLSPENQTKDVPLSDAFKALGIAPQTKEEAQEASLAAKQAEILIGHLDEYDYNSPVGPSVLETQLFAKELYGPYGSTRSLIEAFRYISGERANPTPETIAAAQKRIATQKIVDRVLDAADENEMISKQTLKAAIDDKMKL